MERSPLSKGEVCIYKSICGRRADGAPASGLSNVRDDGGQLNIRFLETVIWLSELGSFRLTADRMKITPAAISNRISAIEQELGVKLFERDTREVKLTREGIAFVDGARRVVEAYDRLVRDLRPSSALAGTVQIGLLPSIAATILPAILTTLREKFPLVRVALTTDASVVLQEKLEQRELDVILGLPGDNRENLHVDDLFTLGMFWVSNRDMKSDGLPLTKEELVNYPIISYEVGAINHRRLIDYIPRGSFDECVIHYSNSLGTTISMIMGGVGISVLPPIVIQEELRAGTLKVLDVREPFPSTKYYAFYLSNPSSKLAPLIATIASKAAQDFCALYDPALATR
jgi:DNA-binding transcriptional LysR family regulator